MLLVNVQLVDRYLRITINSQWILSTDLKWYITLKSTKIHWNEMYKFLTIIHEEKGIYTFNFAIWSFPEKVWQMWELDYGKMPDHTKKLNEINSLKKN